jgi:hypothetical protein
MMCWWPLGQLPLCDTHGNLGCITIYIFDFVIYLRKIQPIFAVQGPDRTAIETV